jgi:hypothetical protein
MIEQNIVFNGKFEDVITINDHLYLVFKKHRIAIIPYIISDVNLLEKIGVIKDFNFENENYEYTLITGYPTTDDATDLVTANRILFSIIGFNIEDASKWIYLGKLYNNLTSDSPITLYGVNISGLNLDQNQEAEDNQKRIKFQMLTPERVVNSSESTFLSSYLRLFQYFYSSAQNKVQ